MKYKPTTLGVWWCRQIKLTPYSSLNVYHGGFFFFFRNFGKSLQRVQVSGEIWGREHLKCRVWDRHRKHLKYRAWDGQRKLRLFCWFYIWHFINYSLKSWNVHIVLIKEFIQKYSVYPMSLLHSFMSCWVFSYPD